MADSYEHLSKEELIGLLTQHQTSARLLVRRDLELTRANERLRTLDRMKSEFVAVAAHQLRTPLSAVKWSFKLLIDGDVGELAPEQKSILIKGYESNERMIRLVNDLLDVDHIESGKMIYEFQVVHIGDVMNNLLIEISARAHERGVTVFLDTSAKVVPPVKADPLRLRAVLQNLVENAVKYTPSGGSVHIMIAPKDNDVLVAIKDTGIGISTEDGDNLFTKFFRGKSAVKLQTEGSGLGLFICKEIIERHGGKIWYESEIGKGTTFYFTIPVLGRPADAKDVVT